MDDSIVRGTTLTHLVQAFKDFYEPAEVHIRIPSPPVVAPCFYGINMADIKELIAANSFRDIKNPTEEELRALAHNF
jgi:amidophosphoribosyltransferase